MLDAKMNLDIDNVIAKLEAAKKITSPMRKADAVAAVAEECRDYGMYWNDKLYDWLMDARG